MNTKKVLSSIIQRFLTSTSPLSTITESRLKSKLQNAFPKASSIQIQDISGGCGAMFEVYVESPVDFTGLTRLQQHQLVNQILAEDVKGMHGIRISTSITPTNNNT